MGPASLHFQALQMQCISTGAEGALTTTVHAPECQQELMHLQVCPRGYLSTIISTTKLMEQLVTEGTNPDLKT